MIDPLPASVTVALTAAAGVDIVTTNLRFTEVLTTGLYWEKGEMLIGILLEDRNGFVRATNLVGAANIVLTTLSNVYELTCDVYITSLLNGLLNLLGPLYWAYFQPWAVAHDLEVNEI